MTMSLSFNNNNSLNYAWAIHWASEVLLFLRFILESSVPIWGSELCIVLEIMRPLFCLDRTVSKVPLFPTEWLVLTTPDGENASTIFTPSEP